MGTQETSTGSPEAPVVFPAVPWLRDGIKYDAYIESCLSHARNQDAEVTILPVHITDTIPDHIEIFRENQMRHVTDKLKEIVEACPEEATHIWFLNADTEVPPDALRLLLEHDADIASGISPMHHNWTWTDTWRWLPAPTPTLDGSTPYFKRLRFMDVEDKIMGDRQVYATGHFCLLVKKEVFEQVNFRWMPFKMRHCPTCEAEVECVRQENGSELTFWKDAFLLGLKCRIDGRVVAGHLPEYPLGKYKLTEE